MSTPAQAVPLLHRFLLTGLVVLTGVLALLRWQGIAPLPPGDSEVIGYTFAALSIVLVLISLLLFKPRIPGRKPQQSIEQYWSAPEVTQSVLVMWFLMEGAGLLAAIGFFLSGEPAPIASLAIALVVFWLNGPNASDT
jgi:hypothetical protein